MSLTEPEKDLLLTQDHSLEAKEVEEAKPISKREAARRKGEFKPGPDPRRNLTKPGPGAPPRAFKAYMEWLEPQALERFKDYVLKSRGATGFKAIVEVFDRLYGKSPQVLEVTERQRQIQKMSDAELATHIVRTSDDSFRQLLLKALLAEGTAGEEEASGDALH